MSLFSNTPVVANTVASNAVDQGFNLFGGAGMTFIGGSHDSAVAFGVHNAVTVMNHATDLTIDDCGHGLRLVLQGVVGKMTILDWGHDTTGAIVLHNAGFAARDLGSHLTSDGHGGTLLSGLMGGGSIDFVGARPELSQISIMRT